MPCLIRSFSHALVAGLGRIALLLLIASLCIVAGLGRIALLLLIASLCIVAGLGRIALLLLIASLCIVAGLGRIALLLLIASLCIVAGLGRIALLLLIASLCIVAGLGRIALLLLIASLCIVAGLGRIALLLLIASLCIVAGLGRCPEQVDRPAARRQGDDGALGALALAVSGPGAFTLALPVRGVHRCDLDGKNLLDGDLDLRLVGIRAHQKRVHVVIQQPIGFLRDHRGQDDVAGVSERRHQAETSSDVVVLAAI
ncbi:hypothetical protein FJ05194_0404 [Mycobacterium tuberculosis FJ05194]|nr:hypothetical protein FJ05194_0404 [Mycobacterium tuberculosis FJ05194]